MPRPILNHINAKKRNKLRRILNYVKSLEKQKRIYIDSQISCLKTSINPVFIVHSQIDGFRFILFLISQLHGIRRMVRVLRKCVQVHLYNQIMFVFVSERNQTCVNLVFTSQRCKQKHKHTYLYAGENDFQHNYFIKINPGFPKSVQSVVYLKSGTSALIGQTQQGSLCFK